MTIFIIPSTLKVKGQYWVTRANVLEFSKGNFPNTQKSQIVINTSPTINQVANSYYFLHPSPSYCNSGDDILNAKLSIEIFRRLCHTSLVDILCYFLNKSVMCNGAKNSSSRPNINLRLKRQAITWNMENKALRRPSSRKPLLTSNLTNTKFHKS